MKIIAINKLSHDAGRSLKPKVTIGICVRNCEVYIKDAINSILEQDFPHEFMELIFVDDGSEDKTLSIIEDFASNISISTRVFHTAWKGLGHARNIVVANAKGDYIVWVDGDMVLSKDFVRKLIEFMEKRPKLGIAKGKQSIGHGGNLLATLETCSRAAGRIVNYRSEKARSKALGTGGAIYRLEAIKQIGGFDENLRGYGEDWDAEIRIRAADWILDVVDVEFYDYERRKLTWKRLWQRYWLRGYYTHCFLHKNSGLISHCKMFPPAAFVAGLIHSRKLYKLTNQRIVFLLPLQNLFKMSAWYAGFIKSHLSSCEPKQL